MRTCFVVLASVLAVSLPAADEPVPVEAEPKHKTVFENEYVRVIDVQIPPGEITLYHRHVLPSIVVYLTRSTNRSESWPDKAILTRDLSPGQSRYAPYDEKPLTHRVTNTGAGLFRVFDIELLYKPSTTVALPPLTSPHQKLHWDEKLARSATVRLEPKGKTAIPPSPGARLMVGISGALQVNSDRANPATRILKWSDYQFFPPQTRLDLSTTGSEGAEAVLLDLKN
jgi:hypothetical protein